MNVFKNKNVGKIKKKRKKRILNKKRKKRFFFTSMTSTTALRLGLYYYNLIVIKTVSMSGESRDCYLVAMAAPSRAPVASRHVVV